MKKQVKASPSDLGGVTFEAAQHANDPTFILLTPEKTLSKLFMHENIDSKTCKIPSLASWKERNPHKAYCVVETQDWQDFSEKLQAIYQDGKCPSVLVGYFQNKTSKDIYVSDIQNAAIVTKYNNLGQSKAFERIKQNLSEGGQGRALFVDPKNEHNKIAMPTICLDKSFNVKSVDAAFSFNDVNRAQYGVSPLHQPEV